MTMLQVIDKDGTVVAETDAASIFSLDVDRMMIVSPPQGFKMVITADGEAPFTAALDSITWTLGLDAHLKSGSVMHFVLLEASIYGVEKS